MKHPNDTSTEPTWERGAAASRIRVLVADDHAVVREGLISLINRQSDMIVVAEAENGTIALNEWRKQKPDISLFDLRMPEVDGVELAQTALKEEPNARVIILTTFDKDEDIYRALRAGAKAYMLKDARRDELLACIRAVYAGKPAISPEIATKLAQRIRDSPLSSRELDVLQWMSRGLSNKEIGTKLCISEGTVKSHVKGVFTKLSVLSRTEAISAASKRGLIEI